MKQQADEFLALFNQIESFLRQQLDEQKETSVSTLLKLYEQKHRGWKDRNALQLATAVRNLLVHERREADRFPAYPSEELMLNLKRCHNQMLHPKRLEHDRLCRVTILERSTKLADVLKLVRENDYSQFPVTKEGLVTGLLTENGITRYLAQYVHAHDSLLELEDITVDMVLSEERSGDNYVMVPRNLTVDDACSMFSEKPVLEALLITQRGAKDESLLGIFTRYDALDQK